MLLRFKLLFFLFLVFSLSLKAWKNDSLLLVIKSNLNDFVKMRILVFILFTLNLFQLNAQESKIHMFLSKQFEYYNYPLQIVSQNDSSVTIISEIKSSYGKDFLITKYSITDTQAVFEKRLYMDSLFEGRFNSKEINFKFFENNQNLSLIIEKKTHNKTLICGKTIDKYGNVSNLVRLDSIIKTDKNLIYYTYIFSLSSNKKNLIIISRKEYLSGFRRDKCIMLNSKNLAKNLEIDLPKNSINVSVNYNFDTDFQNNLFYGVFNKYVEVGDSLIIFKVDIKTHIMYQYKVLKKARLTNFKPLFSNQILMYGIVNISRENEVLCKKSLHFQKINLNTNQVIIDTIIPLTNTDQLNLTYNYKSLTKDPVNKIFTLISDDIVDGNLILIFEHNHNSISLNDQNGNIIRIDPQNPNSTVTEKLEYLICSFNMTTNELEYVTLIPKKIIYNTLRYEVSEINPFSCTYFNNNINLSFYENRANLITRPNQLNEFNSLNQVSTLTGINTVNYSSNDKKIISFNLKEYWRPLNSEHIRKCNKIYYFNYTKHCINIGYYNLGQ